jgi:hypothetical protein
MIKKKATCNRIIHCWDLQKRPCLRPKNHDHLCNPFSSGEKLVVDNKPTIHETKVYEDELVSIAS